jgi:hypothetical protein
MIQYSQNKGTEQAFQSTGSGAAGAVQGLRETTGNSIKYMEDKEMIRTDNKVKYEVYSWDFGPSITFAEDQQREALECAKNFAAGNKWGEVLMTQKKWTNGFVSSKTVAVKADGTWRKIN